MAGLLEQAGYEPTIGPDDADVVVLNTCSVRENGPKTSCSRRLGELRSRGGALAAQAPLIAVAGCVAQQEGAAILRRAPDVDVVVGTQAARRLPAARRRGRPPDAPADRHQPLRRRVSFPLGMARRPDPVKAYVTIIEGCNDYCAFCVVPYTRGHERMRPKAEILAEVREAVAERAERNPPARADRQPLPGARRSGLRLPGPARGGGRRCRASSESGSRARIPGTCPTGSSTPSATCRTSASTSTCRSSPAPRASSRRCGGATRGRSTWTWSQRDARGGAWHRSCRPT